MKKILLIIGLISLLIFLQPLIDNITGHSVINSVVCPSDLVMTYYYSPECSHCKAMKPVIQQLINNSCNIKQINIQENFELAIGNGVNSVPTLIVNDKRLVGEFSLSDVEELINQ